MADQSPVVPDYPSRTFQNEGGRRSVPWEDWQELQQLARHLHDELAIARGANKALRDALTQAHKYAEAQEDRAERAERAVVTRQGWIDVTETDRLPGALYPVIAASSSEVKACYRTGDRGDPSSWSAFRKGEVTHWMPLPKLPGEVDG